MQTWTTDGSFFWWIFMKSLLSLFGSMLGKYLFCLFFISGVRQWGSYSKCMVIISWIRGCGGLIFMLMWRRLDNLRLTSIMRQLIQILTWKLERIIVNSISIILRMWSDEEFQHWRNRFDLLNGWQIWGVHVSIECRTFQQFFLRWSRSADEPWSVVVKNVGRAAAVLKH